MTSVKYELDEAAVMVIAEMFAQVKAAEAGITAVLSYYIKQHGIEGAVRLCADRRTIEVTREQEATKDESENNSRHKAQGNAV